MHRHTLRKRPGVPSHVTRRKEAPLEAAQGMRAGVRDVPAERNAGFGVLGVIRGSKNTEVEIKGKVATNHPFTRYPLVIPRILFHLS